MRRLPDNCIASVLTRTKAFLQEILRLPYHFMQDFSLIGLQSFPMARYATASGQ
jgi:hypothetical protein